MAELNHWESLSEYLHISTQLEKIKENINSLMDNFVSSEPYKSLNDHKNKLLEDLYQVEEKLRQKAVDEFIKTGNKQPFPGMAIRENVKVEYDEKTATEWAVRKSQTMLKLDKTKFEKYAKEYPEDLGFVKVYKLPVATISNREKLSEILKEENND